MNLIRACIILSDNWQTDAYKATAKNIKLMEKEIENKNNYSIEYWMAPSPIKLFNKGNYKF